MLGLGGVVLALWMGLGPYVFGIGGDFIWWYLPLITLTFAWLQLYALRRIVVAARRGRRVGRAVYVALVLSWLCALGFGLTVPDRLDGEMASVLSHLAGDGWLEMSIALCNPLGIIAFATVIAGLAFAIAAGRDPRPSEDDLLDAAEQSAAEPGMVPHPLER